MSNWSREQVRLLINEYQQHPCLYAVKTKQYLNKHARQLALTKIKAVMDSLKPDVTINEIKSKFAGLKATYLTEYKKYTESLGTGKGDEEVIIIMISMIGI